MPRNSHNPLSLDQSLRDLILSTGAPIKSVAEAMDISSSDCLNWWSKQGFTPELPNIINLTKRWAINIDDIHNWDFDPIFIRMIIYKNKPELPEKYAHNPLSCCSTSKHIFDQICLFHGRKVGHQLLDEMGVSPLIFDDVTNKINLRFFEDLLQKYIDLGHSTRDFDRLSYGLADTVRDSGVLSQHFPLTNNYEQALNDLKSGMTYFDSNFDFQFEISKTGADIYCRPSEALKHSMKDSKYGSKLLYAYRASLCGNSVAMAGLDPIPVKVIQCISQGASVSHYQMSFSKSCHLQSMT